MIKQALDGFKNFVTGLGVRGKDRTTANQVSATSFLTPAELTSLYTGEGLSKVIVDMVANDCTRAGWEFLGDPEQRIKREMQRVGVAQAYNEALKWNRLYGGALTVINWDDGRPLDQPFKQRTTNPYRIVSMRTYSSARIWLLATDFDQDPTSPRFERPLFFTVRKMYGAPFRVHWTRCQEWIGEPVPDPTGYGLDLYRRFWGFGIIQACFQEVSDFGLGWSSVSNLFQEAVIGKFKMANLEELLAENEESKILQRMENIALSKSVIKGVLLGAEEEYTRDSLPFSGVAEVIDRMMMRVSAVARIPVSLLFGRGAAGMDATGEGDARLYYDNVLAEQHKHLEPKLEQLKAWMVPYCTPGTGAEAQPTQFIPVWTPSQKDIVEMHWRQSQADLNYFNMLDGFGQRALSVTDVRKNRFQGGYSFDTSVDPQDKLVKEPLEFAKTAKGGGHEGGPDNKKNTEPKAPPVGTAPKASGVEEGAVQ